MGTLCEDQQLLSHCLPKPAANELFGSVWAAEPGLCVAVELDHGPSHGQLGHRRGFYKSHGPGFKPLWTLHELKSWTSITW